MRLDAGQVFGASERLQPVTEAPASVSFITAEEIARYGYRTLADILRGVRGMYVTDDRNFSFVGARGFGKPGDYNSRILLLVNGHRVNDNVFGQAEIGAEFGLDPAMFERVEIIRGPASSLYGDSAFFAVVNVITKTGASLDGSIGDLETGTLGTQLVRGMRRPAPVQRRRLCAVGHGRAQRRRRSAVLPGVRYARRRTTASPRGSTASGVRQLYGRLSFGDSPSPAPTAAGARTCRRRRSARCSTSRSSASRRPIATRCSMRNTRARSARTRVTLRGAFDRFTYDGDLPVRRRRARPARCARHQRCRRARGGPPAAASRGRFRPADADRRRRVHRQHPPEPDVRLHRPGEPLARRPTVVDAARGLRAGRDQARRWLIVNAGLRYDGYEEFAASRRARR